MKRLAFLIAAGLLLAGCQRGPKSCAVCQRAECQGLAFRVVLTNGRTVDTCCPRCGLHYLQNTKQQARSLSATDYATGQWINASNAVYVSGSDVSHCATTEVMHQTEGCCAFKSYDRCLPSLIAFRDRAAATDFQQHHGGKLQNFPEIDNP